ncbi:MAG: peptide deformylase [Coriobacteriia bacterium]|nr:peptide deformylase [Coriobacteriia bacterium]MCL2537157.1 peptide deformylase [Coriobacteriia bacterium]
MKKTGGSARKVVSHPDPRLSQVSKPVDLSSDAALLQLQQLVDDLILTMRKENGAGLAAIQVGVAQRVFVYDIEGEEGEVGTPVGDTGAAALVNPKVILAGECVEDEEGCLSFPALYAPVERSSGVVVEGFDHQGNPVKVVAEGFLARVFQHENDHLDGVSFVDRLSDDDKKHALREYFDLL